MSGKLSEEELLSSVWPEWKIVELIGSGSYGQVYKVVREEFSIKTFSAVKIISVPSNESEIMELKTEGYDDSEIKKYFQNVTSQLMKEIDFLVSLKSSVNIVKIYDYKIVDKEDIGNVIFIRMELLTPLNQYVYDKNLSQTEIIKLGIDICKALENCSQQRIVHRDIKTNNIFVSEHGDYKLGDFGIARRLDSMTSTINHIGVHLYMAPEVYEGKKYDERADIYSLGRVLYKLLNNNKLPFADSEDSVVFAGNMFLGEGKKLPIPQNADEELAKAILKACDYDAEKRFQSASEFKDVLVGLSGKEKNVNAPVVDDLEKTLVADQQMFAPKNRKSYKKLLLIVIILFVFLLSGGIVFAMSAGKIFTESEKSKTQKLWGKQK